MRYYIDYNTGAGNEWVDGALDNAMQAADNGSAYTQCNIQIYDESDRLVAERAWYGVGYDPDDDDRYCEDPIEFGSYGYYGDWYIV